MKSKRKLLNEELDRLSVDQFRKADKIPVKIILDNIRSQHNIGSVFRTADAFRLQEIILCGITATPPNREMHKTALGATDSVEWIYRERTLDAIIELKKDSFQIIAVEQTENSVSLEELELSATGKYAIVFGHEIRGIEQEIIDLSDLVVEIPQYGTKHSLNISVAAGIVIWEVCRQLPL